MIFYFFAFWAEGNLGQVDVFATVSLTPAVCCDRQLIIAGVVDTDESCEYIREFSYKFEMAPLRYLGVPGKIIHEKPEDKNLVSDSL